MPKRLDSQPAEKRQENERTNQEVFRRDNLPPLHKNWRNTSKKLDISRLSANAAHGKLFVWGALRLVSGFLRFVKRQMPARRPSVSNASFVLRLVRRFSATGNKILNNVTSSYNCRQYFKTV
jgi:hypothetical protein